MSRVFFWNQSIIVLFFLILISIGIPVCSGASGPGYIQTVDKGKVGNGTSLCNGLWWLCAYQLTLISGTGA